MAGALGPAHEAAHGVAAEGKDPLPALSVPTRRSGDPADQSDPAGVGHLLCHGRCEPLLRVRPRLGGKEDTAALEAGTETAGLRLEEVEEAVAVRHAGPIRALPGLATQAAAAESAPSLRGPITLGATRAGVRRAGNPPAAYDVAGGRRQQRLPGPTATAPALDPT
jgi:hypothetical protein